MSDLLKDEFQQMDEREFESKKRIGEAISIKDPLNSLELQKMVVVNRKTTIETVLTLFQKESVACVLVCDDSKLHGIFTERDVIMKLIGKGLDHSKEVVEDYMTPAPEVLKGEDPVAFALNRMTEGGFRHIPIVDESNRPVGLVGILDIIRHLAFYYSKDVINLPPEPIRKAQQAPEGE